MVPKRAAGKDSTWYTFQAGGIYQLSVLSITNEAEEEEALTAARTEE